MSKYTFVEAKRLLRESRPILKLSYLEPYNGWLVPMKLKCNTHGTEFIESIGKIYHGSMPCESCRKDNKNKIGVVEAAEKLKLKVPNYKLVENSYTYYNKPAEIYCTEHKIYFKASCSHIVNQNNILACPKCKNEDTVWNKTCRSKANDILKLKYPELELGEDYTDTITPCTVKHNKLGILDENYSLRDLVKKGNAISYLEAKRSSKPKYEKLGVPKVALNKFLTKHEGRLTILSYSKSKVQIRCKCSNVFETKIGHVNSSSLGCPECGVKLRDMMQQLAYAQNHKEELIQNGWIPTDTSLFKCVYCGITKKLNGRKTRCNCNKVKITSNAVSPVSQDWLKQVNKTYSLNIKMHSTGREQTISCQGKNIKVDGYDSKTNTIFEFLGDDWHGNPVVGNTKDKCHPHSETIRLKLFAESMLRLHKLQALGFNVVYLWERDYKSGCLISGILPGNLSSSLSSKSLA